MVRRAGRLRRKNCRGPTATASESARVRAADWSGAKGRRVSVGNRGSDGPRRCSGRESSNSNRTEVIRPRQLGTVTAGTVHRSAREALGPQRSYDARVSQGKYRAITAIPGWPIHHRHRRTRSTLLNRTSRLSHRRAGAEAVRKTEAGHRLIRLLGVSVHNLGRDEEEEEVAEETNGRLPF